MVDELAALSWKNYHTYELSLRGIEGRLKLQQLGLSALELFHCNVFNGFEWIGRPSHIIFAPEYNLFLAVGWV